MLPDWLLKSFTLRRLIALYVWLALINFDQGLVSASLDIREGLFAVYVQNITTLSFNKKLIQTATVSTVGISVLLSWASTLLPAIFLNFMFDLLEKTYSTREKLIIPCRSEVEELECKKEPTYKKTCARFKIVHLYSCLFFLLGCGYVYLVTPFTILNNVFLAVCFIVSVVSLGGVLYVFDRYLFERYTIIQKTHNAPLEFKEYFRGIM